MERSPVTLALMDAAASMLPVSATPGVVPVEVNMLP